MPSPPKNSPPGGQEPHEAATRLNNRCSLQVGASCRPNLVGRLCREPNLNEDDERKFLSDVRTHPDPRQRHKALESLWLAHGKLVASIASKYKGFRHEMDDLISVGFLGFHGAINDFDLTRQGVRLGTYASFRVHHEIQAYLRRNSHPVCLPNSFAYRQLVHHSRRLFEDAERACKREGTTFSSTDLCNRVAARVGLSAFEVEHTLQLLEGGHVSLDDDQHAPLKSPILSSQSQEETVTYTIDAGKVKGRIIALLDEILGTSERRVFQARVMTDNEPARLHELAKEMGVSSERVNQLEASAKRKITVALAKIGYLQPDLEAILRATRVRAPRQKSTSQPVPQKELAAAE